MRVAGLDDGAARLFGAARVFGRHEAREGHHLRRGREPSGITQFGGDRQRGEIVNAAEAAETFDASAEGLDGEEVTELGIDGVESPDGLIDRPHVRAMGLLERGDRPALRLPPGGMACGPRLLRPAEATDMTQEKLRRD